MLIESGSANVEGIAKMADYCEKRLQALGARTERIKATRGHGSIVKGTFRGTGTQRIALIAHMDTVYPANTLATQPYKREGNKLYGPGIADDKGGNALITLLDIPWIPVYVIVVYLFHPALGALAPKLRNLALCAELFAALPKAFREQLAELPATVAATCVPCPSQSTLVPSMKSAPHVARP